MNIATGGGTLVHEIVHPFVRANFPKCPAWLNEGLGSLYEQCGERDGHIVGYPNWRLPGLQRAIKADAVPSFKELTSTTDSEFYGDDKGTNYAQARYLCYYLQEQGKLTKFYHDVRRQPERRPDRLQDAGENARRARHGRVQDEVGDVRSEAAGRSLICRSYPPISPNGTNSICPVALAQASTFASAS